jgi:hypothetical protein
VDIALFWWVQASPSAEEYEERMEKFAKKSHDAAVEYLRKVERNWILYQHIELGVKTFGFRTSNLSEILNSRLLQKRELPPFLVFMATCRMASNDLVAACLVASQLKATIKQETLTPYAIALGRNIRADAEKSNLQGTVEVADDDGRDSCVVGPHMFGRAKETYGLKSRRVVAPSDTDEGSCECSQNLTTGYYCKHAYVAERLNLSETQKSVLENTTYKWTLMSTCTPNRQWHSMQSESEPRYELNQALLEWIHPSYLVETFIESLSNLSIVTPLPHKLVSAHIQPVPVMVAVKPGPKAKKRRIGRRAPWKNMQAKESLSVSASTPVCRPRVTASSTHTRNVETIEIGDYDDLVHQVPVYDMLPDEALTTDGGLRASYMKGKVIFHKFDEGCTPGWYKGFISSYHSRKSAWWCKYICDGTSAQEYWHYLKISDYGKTGVWVLAQ